MAQNLNTKRFISGFILILSVYTIYYLLFADNKIITAHLPHSARHSIKFLVVLLVYMSGTLFLGKLSERWLNHIWHFIHLTLISLLIILWMWHFLISPLPANLRRLGFSIHEFLISPLLYLATGLLGKLIKYKDQK